MLGKLIVHQPKISYPVCMKIMNCTPTNQINKAGVSKKLRSTYDTLFKKLVPPPYMSICQFHCCDKDGTGHNLNNI